MSRPTPGATEGRREGRRRSAGVRGPQVVYVSPLKALATDIQQNLEAPLAEIAAAAAELGLSRAGHPGRGPDR